MEKEKNVMDLKEFWQEGYLLELNRQFLHPLGISMEIKFDKETEIRIRDCRNIQEAPIYSEEQVNSEEYIGKVKNIKIQQEKMHKIREETHGFIIQPILETV